MSIDYDRIFAETLKDMVEKKLDERGIDSITEEQFDLLMEGMAVQQQICVGELRRKFGMTMLPKIRLW